MGSGGMAGCTPRNHVVSEHICSQVSIAIRAMHEAKVAHLDVSLTHAPTHRADCCVWLQIKTDNVLLHVSDRLAAVDYER